MWRGAAAGLRRPPRAGNRECEGLRAGRAAPGTPVSSVQVVRMAQGLRSEWLCLGREPTPGRHKDPTPTPAKLNSGASREERGGTLHQSPWLFLWGPSVILIVGLSANPHQGPKSGSLSRQHFLLEGEDPSVQN